MSAIKDLIGQAVDRLADDLESISRKIHGNPELAYQEVKAAGWLADFLTAQGFKVERGVAGVETAFRATRGDGPRAHHRDPLRVRRAARPSGTRAVTTSSPPRAPARGRRWPPCATSCRAERIQVIGTPAEEGGGGKIRLIKGGVFQTVDAAMMIHGFDRWILHQDLLGIARVGFEFRGKAAHASADPWEGVNALDAVIQTFNNVSMLRQQIRPDARIHGIVTNGRRGAQHHPGGRGLHVLRPRGQARLHVGAATSAWWRAPRARPRRPAAR